MSVDAIDPNLFQEFKSQSLDSIAEMRDLHERLKRDVSDLALVREFYRHMHTVKGNATLFGFRAFADLAHALETLLDAAWKGRITVAHDVLMALERGLSVLDELLRRVAPERIDVPLDDESEHFLNYLWETFGDDESPEARYRQLLNRLAWISDHMVHPDGTLDEGMLAGMVALVRQSRGDTPEPGQADSDDRQPAEPKAGKPRTPTVRYMFKGVDVTDPVGRIQAALGSGGDDENPEEDVDITAELEEAAEQIRDLLSDDAEINAALETLLEETLTVAGSGLAIDDTLRGLLVETLDEFVKVLDIHREQPDTGVAATVRMVRIQEERLREMAELLGHVAELTDRLGDTIGLLPADMQVPVNVAEMVACQAELDHHVDDLAARLSGLGQEPVSRLFSNTERLVTDVAARLGKSVKVELNIGDGMISRNLVEELEGPIVHLVRNAVDHGLEDTDARADAGKSTTGRMTVSASLDGTGNLVVTIADDGQGIDPSKVRTTALARGLVTPQQIKMMSPGEIQRLILEPTFSTAAQLTDLSGRGIGLDLVNAAVTGLGGSLELESTVGQGTTFRMTVPLHGRPATGTTDDNNPEKQSA